MLNINYTRLIAFLASLAIMAALSLFLARTDLGRPSAPPPESRCGRALRDQRGPRLQHHLRAGLRHPGIIGCVMLPFYLVSPSVGWPSDPFLHRVVLGASAASPARSWGPHPGVVDR